MLAQELWKALWDAASETQRATLLLLAIEAFGPTAVLSAVTGANIATMYAGGAW